MPDQAPQPNREELFQMAINAARHRQHQGARIILRRILSEDRRSVRAMLWMARLARSDRERRAWLDHVLAVEPDNRTALDAIHHMTYALAAARNRALYRIAVGLYVTLVLIIAFIIVALAFAGS